MVNEKRLLLSLLFSNTKINGDKTEISYQKPFQMIFDRVSEITHEKLDEKTIFELTKKPVNKEKSRAFGSAHPIWLRDLDSNQEPIDYIDPKITSRDGLYHHRGD
jgi:hypothetical protein